MGNQQKNANQNSKTESHANAIKALKLCIYMYLSYISILYTANYMLIPYLCHFLCITPH